MESEKKMLRCGMYLRVSREDGEGESGSIQNQRSLIHQYVKEHQNMELVGEWQDDGRTGSSFERPGFQAMMDSAMAGELDCILTKDLSRLGREYIQTGRYIREIFPLLGIRYIAIADHYDSDKTEFVESALVVPILNLMNDAYCRDISKKVRWQQKEKREAGEDIGAFAVYGYKKHREDIHRLIEDEAASQVVRCIFRLRLGGMSPEGIVRQLNLAHIPSPREYKILTGSCFRSGFDREMEGEHRETRWSPFAVRRILQNEMYAGVMQQGKDRKLSYKLPDRIRLRKEEWYQVPGKVPIIIPRWMWDAAARVGARRIRCQTALGFCKLWAGYEVPSKLERSLYTYVWKCACERAGAEEKEPDVFWIRRLFVTLFVQEIFWSGGGMYLTWSVKKSE